MGRTDIASRVIDTSRERVFAAMIDPDALACWLPPEGMTGRFEHFPGGTRVELRADDVPEGISAQDHQDGMNSSLANLARYLSDHNE